MVVLKQKNKNFMSKTGRIDKNWKNLTKVGNHDHCQTLEDGTFLRILARFPYNGLLPVLVLFRPAPFTFSTNPRGSNAENTS